MELDKSTFDKLCSFIEQSKTDPNYELEVRFYGKNFKKVTIDYDTYQRVFQRLTYSKENNGLGLQFKIEKILDIIVQSGYNEQSDVETTRVSITDDADIKKYWLFSDFTQVNMDHVKVIEKEKIDRVDDENYNLRISLNYEKPDKNINQKDKNLVLNREVSKTIQKVFRMKNRYSIQTDDGLFSIDMTATKMGKGAIFKETNTLKEQPKFEIEIEYKGGDSNLSVEEIANKYVSYMGFILCTIQNNDMIMKQEIVNEVLEGYGNLTESRQGTNEYDFIAANPVTFHRVNLLKSDKNINIYNKYAVTLKADGERHFMYVLKSSNPQRNGRMYLFDTNFHVIDTGFQDSQWADSLFEGELVKIGTRRKFFLYDVLFEKGRDVRRRYLAKIGDESKDKFTPRFEILRYFFGSKSRQLSTYFTDENSIELQLKPYRFLLHKRDNPKVMFDMIAQLWNERSLQPFYSDGLIFTPITEFYPNRGGSWEHLLKWKPPHLNTIDFLIRTVKYDNGKDAKSPHITLIKRPDGKTETELRQYKTVKLYVGSFRKNNQRKSTPIAVEFNPDNTNSNSASTFNVTNIMIDDNDKMIAIDPFTNEEEQLEDDMVVEFGFDPEGEVGYQWKPYRHRKDKTLKYKSGGSIANNERTANDVFQSIRFPVTEQMLLTGEVPVSNTESGVVDATKTYFAGIHNENAPQGRLPYQDFHNHFIKYILYYSTSPAVLEGVQGDKGKILDLCAGKGVDMNKIARARYYELVGVELDFHSVKKAQELYKQFPVKPKRGIFLRGDTSKLIFPEQAAGITEFDKLNMKRFIPTKYLFDTVSLMFCFHYFFKDEISLRSILQNCNDNLKIGGYLIGTTFDGERIYNALKGKSLIEGNRFDGSMMWKIEKKYKTKISFDGKPVLGKQIDVYVGTIGNVHPEYLVSFPFVDNIMKEYGFEKVFIKPFSEFYQDLDTGNPIEGFEEDDLQQQRETISKMSEDEKRWSFMSSAFVYRKVKNTPDSLFRKLVDLMDKKQKKEDTVDGKTSEVSYSVVNESTEKTLVDIEQKEETKESVMEMMKGGGEEDDLSLVADSITDSIANRVARKVLTKVAKKINQSIHPPLPTEITPNPSKMESFVPPPVNENTAKHVDDNDEKVKEINFVEKEVEDSGEEYESDDGFGDI